MINTKVLLARAADMEARGDVHLAAQARAIAASLEEDDRSPKQKAYQDFFLKKLADYGVSSPADLTEDQKSKFFTEIKQEWKGTSEAAYAGICACLAGMNDSDQRRYFNTKDFQNPYGVCPSCGAPGVTSERRPDGNTTCANGHVHASADFQDGCPSTPATSSVDVAATLRRAEALIALGKPFVFTSTGSIETA